jgi:N-acyl-D-amino-acid deacylase
MFTAILPLLLPFYFCLLICSAASATDHAAAPLPVTGDENPVLSSFDELMRSFMAEHQVPGAALAVAKGGELVYARGFGFADVLKKTPVQPDSLFRIASLSKPLTAVAVLQLAEQGKLALDEPMLDQLPPDTRPARLGDPRIQRITIRQLLRHTGGWDSDKTGYDPMFRSLDIAKAEKVEPPAKAEDIIRFMLHRKFDFEPGERYAYSNFGYCLLGRIIGRAAQQAYEQYVKEHVLAPLGIRGMRIGRTLLDERAPGEVEYTDRRQRQSPAVAGPQIGKLVPEPYGAFYLEAMDAHGGWLASAIDIVRFVAAFHDPERCLILKPDSVRAMWQRPPSEAGYEKDGAPKAAYYACGWMVRPIGNAGKVNAWHAGQLAGTSTLMVHRHDGLSWAVLFNTDSDAKGKALADAIDPLVHVAADAVKQWPRDK